MANRAIASALEPFPNVAALHDVIKARFDAVPQDALLVYLVDSVAEGALVFLAEQFDVLGYGGWALATNEADRRALIGRAIELHRYKGTPWAIEEALKTIGFDKVIINERIGLPIWYHNGDVLHDGSHTHSNGDGAWAFFSVVINIDGFGGVLDAAKMALARALIMEYKNARSWLVDVSYGIFNTEEIIIEETLTP